MTIIASKDYQKFPPAGRQILANYTLDLPRAKAVNPEDLVNINEPTLFLLDEAYAWLESRTSQKAVSRYLSYILFQSRKRELDIVLSMQLFSTIDVRFRNMTDLLILTDKTEKGFLYTFYKPATRIQARFLLPFENAQKYYGLYDTMEKVDPIDESMMVSVMSDKSRLLPKLDEIISEMEKESPLEEWSKGAVVDYCLEKHYPGQYPSLIFNRIKRRLKAGKDVCGDVPEPSIPGPPSRVKRLEKEAKKALAETPKAVPELKPKPKAKGRPKKAPKPL
jgi:hypothetical protein